MQIINWVLAIIFFLTPLSALAQEPTATPEGSLTEKIKERLQETAEEGLVAIKEQITTKVTAPQKKAYIGKISTLNQDQITLTYKDQTFTVDLDKNTEYFKGANTVLEFEDLKVGNFVIAMGFLTSLDNKFSASRVSVINEPQPPLNRQLVQGKISEVDGQKLKINGKTISLSTKTKLIISGVDEPETEDISLGDYLFAIVTLDKNGDVERVNSVLIQPGRQNPAGLEPTNRPTATPSGNVEE